MQKWLVGDVPLNVNFALSEPLRPYWAGGCSEDVFCRPSTAPVVVSTCMVVSTSAFDCLKRLGWFWNDIFYVKWGAKLCWFSRNYTVMFVVKGKVPVPLVQFQFRSRVHQSWRHQLQPMLKMMTMIPSLMFISRTFILMTLLCCMIRLRHLLLIAKPCPVSLCDCLVYQRDRFRF